MERYTECMEVALSNWQVWDEVTDNLSSYPLLIQMIDEIVYDIDVLRPAPMNMPAERANLASRLLQASLNPISWTKASDCNWYNTAPFNQVMNELCNSNSTWSICRITVFDLIEQGYTQFADAMLRQMTAIGFSAHNVTVSWPS